jgi:hypothetical protein
VRTREKFRALLVELDRCADVRVTTRRLTFYNRKRVRDEARQAGTPEQVLDFYQSSDGFELSWEMVDAPDPDALGRVRILSLSDVVRDWRGVVHFDDSDPDDPIRHFQIFDFFVDEGCVGLYFDEEGDDSLHLHDFGPEPFRLDLDIPGYIEMLVAARGFLYWQDVIKALRTGVDDEVTARFRTFIPQLFPAFSFAEFADTYQRVRLSAR